MVLVPLALRLYHLLSCRFAEGLPSQLQANQASVDSESSASSTPVYGSLVLVLAQGQVLPIVCLKQGCTLGTGQARGLMVYLSDRIRMRMAVAAMYANQPTDG